MDPWLPRRCGEPAGARGESPAPRWGTAPWGWDLWDMLVPVGAPMGLVVGWMRRAGRLLCRWLATARRMARVRRV